MPSLRTDPPLLELEESLETTTRLLLLPSTEITSLETTCSVEEEEPVLRLRRLVEMETPTRLGLEATGSTPTTRFVPFSFPPLSLVPFVHA